ncbi:MAG: PASTA domain-containing protein [Clostridia bacterium]|nr:PASTA domain-containing protein [Clostridia bacterium]
MAEKLRCMCCMHTIPDAMDICPYCGQYPFPNQPLPYLPAGTVIGGRYIIGKALKVYAEGVTYIGFDTLHNAPVKIREFLPLNIVKRGGIDMSIRVKVDAQQIYYSYLQSFVQMWRKLMRMHKSSSFAHVVDIITNENLTAYVVTEHIEAVTLDEYLFNHNLRLPWDNVKELFTPAIATLEELHSHSIVHGAISPSTLLVSNDGRLIFGGFAIPEYCNEINGYIFNGYSPIECYSTGYPVGTWTDIYAFTASLYHTITGLIPPKSTDRAAKDQLMIQREIVNSLPAGVIKVLFSGMRILPPDRIKTASELRGAAPVYEANNIPLEQAVDDSRQQSGEEENIEQKASGISEQENNVPDDSETNAMENEEPGGSNVQQEAKDEKPVKKAVNKKNKKKKKGGAGTLFLTAIITFIILCVATVFLYPTVIRNYIQIPQFEPYVELFAFLPGVTQEPTTEEPTTAAPVEKKAVPKVVGKSYKEAFGILTKEGFKVKKVYVDNPGDKTADNVYSVSPSAGKECEKGALVTVKVWKAVTD